MSASSRSGLGSTANGLAKGVMTVQSVDTHETEVHLVSDWKGNVYTGPGRFVFAFPDGKVSEWRIISV